MNILNGAIRPVSCCDLYLPVDVTIDLNPGLISAFEAFHSFIISSDLI